MSKFKQVFDAVKPFFKERGFRKSGNNFYRAEAGMLTVVNFQGSSHGGLFYVNIGSGDYVSEDGAKPTSRELKVSSRRIGLFADTNGWLYDMSDSEFAILARKLEERLCDLDGSGAK